MAPHSSTLAWRIPWTEELGRLQSMGSLRVRHDWATSLSLFTFKHYILVKQDYMFSSNWFCVSLHLQALLCAAFTSGTSSFPVQTHKSTWENPVIIQRKSQMISISLMKSFMKLVNLSRWKRSLGGCRICFISFLWHFSYENLGIFMCILVFLLDDKMLVIFHYS